MNRTRVESNLERQFLIGLATSKPFLASVAPQTDPLLFPTQYVQQVARWCLDFYSQHDAPIGDELRTRFNVWRERDKPEDHQAQAVGDFIDSLATEAHQNGHINAPYLAAELGKYLTRRRLTGLKEELSVLLDGGDETECLNVVQNFKSVNLNAAEGYYVDKQAIRLTFAEPPEPLFDWPKPANRFFGHTFCRDRLVALQSPDKRGKTWWEQEIAFRALEAKRKVAFFEVGDLSEVELNTRFFMRMAGLPQYQSDCGGVNYPRLFQLKDVAGKLVPVIENDIKTFAAPLDAASANRGRKQFFRRRAISNEFLRLSVHPNSTVNVAGIHAILNRWRHELNFVPDVIVIDYADILAPENNRKEARDQVDETWRALRRLSQEWKACVVTATQSNAQAYTAKTQSARNFSNDKRKLAHVTAMLALNQTAEEKRQQIVRLNWIVRRAERFDVERCLYVAQCLSLAEAYVMGAM